MTTVTSNILCFVLALTMALVAQADADPGQAQDILKATGVKGGFVVHVGCGDGKLTAALRSGGTFYPPTSPSNRWPVVAPRN